MSGIAAIICFDGAAVQPGLIEKMTSAMGHRGPDGIRHWRRNSVALGQCMMWTTLESLKETQPLVNEDESLVLIMDGRIDNWEELRRQLLERGAKLRSRADAELALRAYEAWGRDCLAHIDGDFSIVIWDSRRRIAFCGRDRVGNKPFYYNWNGRRLIVASELQAVLGIPSVPQLINEGMLAEFLSLAWCSRDETMWHGVMRLMAAHWMVASEGGIELQQYWQPDYLAALPYTAFEEAAEDYRAVLADQVRRMSRSHKVVAYEVSGGLDSSALFAMSEHLRRQNRLPAPEIAGLSLLFPDDTAANEIQYSRSVGQHLHHDLHEILATAAPYSWYASTARFYREFPGYPNGTMALGLRQQARVQGSRTIVTGVGGDEWLGMQWEGLYYAEEIALRNWGNTYNCFVADCRALGVPRSVWWLLRFGLGPLLPEHIKQTYRWLSGNAKRNGGYWLSQDLRLMLRRRRPKNGKLPELKRWGQISQFLMLNDAYSTLAREMEERTCARLGLELRSPFNSRPIIELAFATPERFRSRGRTTKRLHRFATQSILPELVVERSTKADFMCTFRAQLADIGENHMREIASRRADWIDPSIILEIYNCAQGKDLGTAGWILSTLVGCDALCSNV